MAKEILDKLQADLDEAMAGLDDAEQAALLLEVKEVIRDHLDEAKETEEATLIAKLQATAVRFKVEHPTLAESFIFAVNSLNNAGL